jgi:hypothetical protein
MSSDLNLNNIAFQSQLRDKPVRENFTDIQNEFNSLRSEVYASIASTASEVVSARDNFGNLSDNIHIRRVFNKGNSNDFGSYDYCSQTSTPSMKVRLSSGRGVINGVGVEWSSATSATLTAPTAGTKRVDKVVANTDGSVTIIPGTATTGTPIPPSLSTTQEQISVVYLTAGTTTLNNNTQIFNVLPENDFPDYVMTDAATVYKGKYMFNNLILDSAMTFDENTSADIYNLMRSLVEIRCSGNVYTTQNHSISQVSWVASSFQESNGNYGVGASLSSAGAGGAIGMRNDIVTNLFSGGGGAGADAYGSGSGGGGGGGAGIFAAGGSGGAGVAGGSGAVLGGQRGKGSMSLFLTGYNIYMRGDIDLTGFYGRDGGGFPSQPGAGGGGGGAGGSVFLFANKDLDINCTITLTGGYGGNGGADNGAGGGGGAGGSVIARYNTITDNLTTSAAGGSAGSGNGSGGAGVAGGAGIVVKKQYNDLTTSIIDGWLLSENIS